MGFERRSFGPRTMHKAVCADCKKECEVPFEPTAGKPVYCRECFAKRKPYQSLQAICVDIFLFFYFQ